MSETEDRRQQLANAALGIEAATTPDAFITALDEAAKRFPLFADETTQHRDDHEGWAVARFIHAIRWQLTQGYVRPAQAPAQVIELPAIGGIKFSPAPPPAS